jgi:hypothetical protein
MVLFSINVYFANPFEMFQSLILYRYDRTDRSFAFMQMRLFSAWRRSFRLLLSLFPPMGKIFILALWFAFGVDSCHELRSRRFQNVRLKSIGRVYRSFKIHIGILSHPGRSIRFLRRQYRFWISDFLHSRFNGGVHFVSEIPMRVFGIPTAVLFAKERSIRRRQAAKRIRSLEYYLANSSTGFFLYTTDNAFVWSLNLKYLFDELNSQRLTADSHFIWGNCMSNYDGTFLQGGSGYFMSRYTAQRLFAVSAQWLRSVTQSEDVAFTDFMAMVGLTSMYNATSEFIMGQYINYSRIVPMQSIDLDGIGKCPREPPDTEGCRGFFARYNRLAVLHRLTATAKYVSGMPPPVYDYPDNLAWYQAGEMSDVCLK